MSWPWFEQKASNFIWSCLVFELKSLLHMIQNWTLHFTVWAHLLLFLWSLRCLWMILWLLTCWFTNSMFLFMALNYCCKCRYTYSPILPNRLWLLADWNWWSGVEFVSRMFKIATITNDVTNMGIGPKIHISKFVAK